jgi:hypothetical protein
MLKNFAISFTPFVLAAVVVTAVFSKTREKALSGNKCCNDGRLVSRQVNLLHNQLRQVSSRMRTDPLYPVNEGVTPD